MRKKTPHLRRKTPGFSKTLVGTVKRHPEGFGFLISEDPDQPDVYLPRREMQGLMNYDQVKITAQKRRQGKDLFSGQVVQIVRRFHERVIGPCQKGTDTQWLIQDSNRQWGEDFRVQIPKDQKIQPGEWVQARVSSWPGDRHGFFGVMTASLGFFPGALEDNIRVLQQNSIPFVFSEACLKEAQNLPGTLSPSLYRHRKDLKSLPFVTIDGKTAKDFDDAIYVCPQKGGAFRLYVAIADVSHYVPVGSSLDKEAYQRGNSTYFPDFVAPMLPAPLSENLCSLKPHQDRLAFVADLLFDKEGKEVSSRFYEAVIHSQRRFTYEEVQNMINRMDLSPPGQGGQRDPLVERRPQPGSPLNEGPQVRKEQAPPPEVSEAVQNNVYHATRLARVLLRRRQKNHFIELEIPETQVRLDKTGQPVEIVEVGRWFSHQVIEELMLAANQAVARFITRSKVPGFYRVHEEPQSDGLKLLESFARGLGFKSRFSATRLHSQISDLTRKYAHHPLLSLLYQFVLRSLSQALYSADRKNHFGLNFTHYTHFTSPIRRYSDLVVHRILKNILKKRPLLSKKPLLYTKEKLSSIATVVSACEQRSVKAERQIQDLKRVRFIKRYLGEEMEGRICSVTRFGFFVKLDLSGIEGLVRKDLLPGTWEFEEALFRLKSGRSGKCYILGDRVRVQVSAASLSTGQIDFDLKAHTPGPLRRMSLSSVKPRRRRR